MSFFCGMENLTFDSMPAAILQLLDKVSNIEKQLNENNNSPQSQIHWLTIDELCDYLPGKPAKATIYAKVHRREIPHQKQGKRLSFLKNEIDTWLKSQSRPLTQDENLDGTDYLKMKGHRK